MEFRIAKNEFLRGLRLAQGIADRKSTMPMLANVLLRQTTIAMRRPPARHAQADAEQSPRRAASSVGWSP